MDWVKSFYTKQDQWINATAAALTPHHHRRAATLLLPHRSGPYRILELGCGGGQMAVALSKLGHDVIGVDLIASAVRHARALASRHEIRHIQFIEGDFYNVEAESPLDMVCYFDGFGIGTDQDQIRLLPRIADWLVVDGFAFIDVYTPWYWRAAAGQTMHWTDASRRYNYDPKEERLLDTWWPTSHPEEAVTQSLRCYSPEELKVLLQHASLTLGSVIPGGAYDPETNTYRERAPLDEAMQYLAVVSRQTKR